MRDPLDNQLRRIAKALTLEEEGQFSDLQGKEQVFSHFMSEAWRILHAEGYGAALDLSQQFQHYPAIDLVARMKLVRKAQAELKNIRRRSSRVEAHTLKSNFSSEKLWEIDVKWVPGVGEKIGTILANLGIRTILDLLCCWPRQYLDFSKRVLIRDLEEGKEATVIGLITRANAFQSPRNPNLSILDIKLKDPSGLISLHSFIAGKSSKFLLEQYKKRFPVGSLIMVSGIAKRDRQTRFQLINFSHEIMDEKSSEPESESLAVGRIVPIYRLTEGLQQYRLRQIIHACLNRYEEAIPESLDPSLVKSLEFIPLKEAIKQLHFPENEARLEEAKRRIAFEEFFTLQLPLAQSRYELIQNRNRPNPTERKITLPEEGVFYRLLKSLPYALTSAQERVLAEIKADLQSDHPMNRLLQGDVGSGKTVVALLTIAAVIDRGEQTALMAPTEILAEQHFQKYQVILTELGLRPALLIGSQKSLERKEVITGLANGQIQVVIGTHALIQDGVEFDRLGLAIIDEQHRFGVRQRDQLRHKGTKGRVTDCLYMTATPIPRTLALTLYGNLDTSELDELPPGRQPIKTKLVEGQSRHSAHNFVKTQLAEGHQAYIVYPLIDESESLTAKAVTKEAEKIARIYGEYRIGVIHGKLRLEEKDAVMRAFRQNEIQVLIGTTVIEVGVDVPNASVMIIENAERFGLAQLHQLRGRVGRGAAQSYCLLFGDVVPHSTGWERLKIMETTENGFIIAQKDLELRGPGELIGTKQSGLSDFGLHCLTHYADLLSQARIKAQQLVTRDPKLENISELLTFRLKDLRAKANLIGA
ncbi:MAG: ATP-dependent DNA helicase RecG [Candidatus Caenarcaniphilales bacterium]|nr:ATP-dependent DNA helicase RecG [Candidatus Caenarcaniphilales bacterium]